MNKYNIITICGPTAGGKTKLAVQLAQKFQGEIISGDSRQVYQGMRRRGLKIHWINSPDFGKARKIIADEFSS